MQLALFFASLVGAVSLLSRCNNPVDTMMAARRQAAPMQAVALAQPEADSVGGELFGADVLEATGLTG
jgi:hypothetical protein